MIKVTNYGVHVRLPGGIDGLMHGENNRGAGHLKIGDAVNVEVLQIDNERRRISLAFSMAGAELREFFAAVEATQEEWERTLVAHPTGSLVEGQVSRLFVAGTSIVLADGASGYLPDKELSWTTKGTVVKETLKVGQFVKLVVIGFKTAKRRLTFSQRKCTAQPWDDPDLRPVVGQEYKGVVSNVVDYGAFIKLPTGLEGLLHMSALPEGWKYETGQAVTVVVTSIEDERQRISLGLGVPRTQMGEDTHTLVS